MNQREARRHGYSAGLTIASRLTLSPVPSVMARESETHIQHSLEGFKATKLRELTEIRASVLALAYHMGLVAGVSAGIGERRTDDA